MVIHLKDKRTSATAMQGGPIERLVERRCDGTRVLDLKGSTDFIHMDELLSYGMLSEK